MRAFVLVLVFAMPATAWAQSSSETQLSSLDPATPEDYQRLAEQLAAKSHDVEARTTAIRLFHIAAWLAPEKLGTGCLRSLIAIARSPEEGRRFRSALYLLDAEAEPDLLVPLESNGSSGDASAPPPELLYAVRALRRGDRDAARQAFSTVASREFLSPMARSRLREEFQAMLTTGALSDAQLARLIELELAWSSQGARGGRSIAASLQPWEAIVSANAIAPSRGVTLLDLTEFDPRQNRYANGSWNSGSADTK